MIKKILIANRGEIAVRIIRACHELNMEAVAVYSEADRTSPHVYMADEAYCIGPPSSKASYLRSEKILKVARDTKTGAIHPGYGFLSENPDFAASVLDSGISWIGPPPTAMRKLGNKLEARKIALSSGVPVIPGSEGDVKSGDAHNIATKIGYPLLIKAVSGGGGKGMRIVHNPDELTASIDRAMSEAGASFSDSRVFIEKLIANPRHIEIQIAADVQGNIITLTERECSVQRRYQKIIEESPSTFINRKMWKKMAKCAEDIIRASDYTGVGTVEFLMDSNKNFYFLEMNARLQVEHPVTEMLLSIDLVQEQIRLASGEKLSIRNVTPNGHAIECRIYAEDGFNHFLPSTGTILELSVPGGNGVRFDHALRTGLEVTPYYDPLIGKLITWGNNRNVAIKRMKQSLKELLIAGIRTTIPFCNSVISHPKFSSGNYTTHFIEEEMDALIELQENENTLGKNIAIAVTALHTLRASSEKTSLNGITSNWKTTGRKDALQ